ncbi:hypothetical protein BBJ28_00007345 [Nothophytophthora sp. Chile5]|nr:hypothetical protein BBJ28_00007345 [Nothophytophthora sp. Chile5]
MEGGGVALAVDDDTPAERRRSLASQMEEMASDGAFLRAIQQKSPLIAACRTILRKPTGRRTLEDIHVVHRQLPPPFSRGRGELTNASALIASAPTELVLINRVVFAELLKESHDADSNANTLEISKRFRSNKDIVRNIFLRSSSQRSEKDLKFAVEYLKSVKFFSRFSFEVRKQLCKVMRLISSVSNTVLFEEGQVGRHFYIIFTGCVDVSVHIKNRFEETTESVVSRRGEGDYFGELALSQADGVRRATVMCTDFCELLVLGRDQYEPLIKKYQNEYHAQYAQMLRKNPYFLGPEWDDNTIEGMCSVMAEKYIPFKGEICKQVRQQSRCKFNDIFVRDYSILAESPMKILVLSRFDIFHLMSAEARASLQRSSNGYIRESIPSRALKSVAWDKYKKAFLSSVLAEKHQQQDGPFGGGRGSARPSNVIALEGDSRGLGKSQSTPLLSGRGVAQPLVAPGCLILERRRGVAVKAGGYGRARPAHGSPKATMPQGDKTIAPQEGGDDTGLTSDEAEAAAALSAAAGEISSIGRSHSLPPDGTGVLVGGLQGAKPERNVAAGPAKLYRSSTTTAPGLSPSGRFKLPFLSQSKLSEDGSSESPPDQQRVAGASALSKRRISPETADSRGFPLEKPLALPGVSPLKAEAVAEVSTSSSGGFRYDLRRCGRVRTDKVESALIAARNAPAGAAAASLWDPVHGVCQPFAVLGFMMEILLRPVSRGTSSSSKPRTTKSVADQLRQVAAAPTAAGNLELTRFRVLGKFRDVNDALDLFRRVCAVERAVSVGDGRDCSRFAIYKEDEMTLALENFPSGDAAASEQFGAADLVQATGQRFACVGVILPHSGGASVESVAVHVYQCFPTPQSAVRFARQVAATLLAPGALSIVPLFEWIPLAELERFDARSADLEQELEQLMRRGAREDGGSTLTLCSVSVCDCAALGLGIYHSGVELAGEEFSYASGAGVFASAPREAPGATFREAVTMGFFEGSAQEAQRLAYSLRDDFHGDAYNLFTKNCNTYADALCQLLLGKAIPAYVNRAAYLGSFLSCLMPADAAAQAPVGDPNVPPRRTEFLYTPFAAPTCLCASTGSGQTAGGSSSAASDQATLANRREKPASGKKTRLHLCKIGRFVTKTEGFQRFSKCDDGRKRLGLAVRAEGTSSWLVAERLVRKRQERGAMGKAASPAKKNSAHSGGRESSSRSIAFDGPESGGGTLMVVPRVESTIASRETATHLAFAKRLSTPAALGNWLTGVCTRKDDFVYAPTSHYLRVLNDHCQWDRDARSAVLVVVGQPGTGKSTLLANWAEQRRRSERGARELIYEHYSGCSYDSVKLSLFLFRFMHQLKISYNLRDFELPREHEEEKLKFSFSRCLDAAVGKGEHSTGPASKRKRTEDGGDSLSWLPNSFPAGVRIIVSTTQTSTKGKSQLRCCSSVVRQPALYEEKRFRELDPEEKRLILAARGSSNPLYVRLLLNALELFEPNQSEQRQRWLERACESNQLNVIYELLMKQWNAMLLEDLVLELNDRRASLDASSSNNGVIPSSVSNGNALDRKAGDVETLQIAIEQRALLVRHTLSLLAVTRYGLSENDFVRLFGDGVSRSICQQLLVLLRPHLMQIRRYDCGPSTHMATPSSSSNQDSKESDVIVLYDLSHNQLRLLARYGFLRDDQLRHCYYRELAVYFDAMDACQRRVDELPVQLERCAMWNVLQSVLVNMKMFQLWWSERNRQEFFSYWMVLSANCSVHDPVDDFIRSLDEFIAHEDPSAEQLLSLFLTITEFLRTWQKVDDSRASNLVLNRPSPPQLQEFISSLGNFSLANLSEDEAKRVQKEIEALCIHPSDGYYVRRWIWTQFPLIGIAFETRVFRSAAFGRSSGPGVDEEAASGSRGDSAGPETGGQAESSSQYQAMGNPNLLPKALNDKGAASKKASRGSAGVVLPKGLSVGGEKANKPLVPGKRRPPHKTPPSLALESVAEGEIGALEFLSVESSEGSLGSVSKLEVCT